MPLANIDSAVTTLLVFASIFTIVGIITGLKPERRKTRRPGQ